MRTACAASDVWVVVMAGGVGARFWPLSRAARPKQLLPVLGERTLLEETLARALSLAPVGRTLVVTGRSHAEATRTVASGLPADAVLSEPRPRNTAACVGLAAAWVAARDPEAVLAVLPADHFIGDREAFAADASQAVALARVGHLVTLGIPPTRPATGYGYLRVGAAVGDGAAAQVDAFVEKPDAATATAYLAGGRHLWNSGMFFFRADRILDELAAHLPDHADALRRIDAARGQADEAEVCDREYEGLDAVSLDHGVMEHAADIVVVRATFPWSDVGHWAALLDLAGPRAGESVHRGPVVEADGRGNVIVAEGGLVATVGLQDTVVVHAGDAVLVCPVERAEEVRRIVDELRRRGLVEYL